MRLKIREMFVNIKSEDGQPMICRQSLGYHPSAARMPGNFSESHEVRTAIRWVSTDWEMT